MKNGELMKRFRASDSAWRRPGGIPLLAGYLILVLTMTSFSPSPLQAQDDNVPVKPFHVSSRSFDRMVLQAKTPVLVDFWAPWCGPCKQMAPWLEELSEEYQGQIRFVKLNVDENGTVARRYRVFGIPTLVLFHEGEEVDRLVGLFPKKRIKSRIDAQLP